MDITVTKGNIEESKVDSLVLGFFENAGVTTGKIQVIDRALNGGITQLVSAGDIKGKVGEANLIYSLGKLPAARIVIVGLGKQSDLTKDRIRQASAIALRILRQKGAKEVAIEAIGSGINGITPLEAAQSIVEGAILGLYSFKKHVTKEKEQDDIKQLSIIEFEEKDIERLSEGINRGKVIANAVVLARDMVNEPANYMTPVDMAETAKGIAETYGLKINIFDTAQMRELGMGALLGVSQGSQQPPKFIVLRYKGNDETEKIDVALVGKGITFDSGGISLKPSENLDEMKGDMAGGAAVMAAIAAIAELKCKVNVLAIVPATENMPGGKAYKPGDILTAMNGKTIEIITTDAEGRLILADALAYVKTFDVGCIIDVATLTGACHIALGEVCTGVFGNNQNVIDRIIESGKDTGELMWQMPMYDQYAELIKSEIADLKNSGGRWGGAITAAKFLEEFVGNTPWVHLDIAGTSDTKKEQGYIVKGATGIPVRTLIHFILDLAKR